MLDLPSPVLSSIGTRKVTLRRFAHPYFEAFCNNCTWTSFTYAKEVEAEDRADSHADRCCARINAERAMMVGVVPTLVQDLEHGQRLLLRDLRAMDVENIQIFDDEVMVTYSISGLESQIMMLPVDHVVKVILDEPEDDEGPCCIAFVTSGGRDCHEPDCPEAL